MKEKILAILKRDIHLDDEWVADEIMKLLPDKVAKMNTKTIRFEKGRRYPTEVANLVDDLFDKVIFNQCYLPFSEHKECLKPFTVTITVSEDEDI